MVRTERLPFILLAVFSLIIGLLAGLQRMGWGFPVNITSTHHGGIMVGGFVGTLITLEKIIPLRKKFLFAVPLLSGASVIAFFFDFRLSVALLLAASGGFCMVTIIYWLKEHSLVYSMMVAGALCWFIGNVTFGAGGFYPAAVPWWMGFVLLVICSERLDLMKFLPVTPKQKLLFAAMSSAFVIGSLLTFHGVGKYFAAVSLAGLALWLMRHDVVGINLKKQDLKKYVGVALLAGYCALLLSGVFVVLISDKPLGYDILVHTFFIGFVFSMIFAHGPIILPGVLGISVRPYHPVFYLWLILLHTSWTIRVVADINLDMQTRKYSGLISAVAIIGYFLSIAVTTFRGRRAKTI
jgi:hypothetical protein